MLQTIDLCVTDEWFIANKLIVYIKQTYRLHQTNISFMANKHNVYII